MQSQADISAQSADAGYLDYLAQLQVDLMCIRDLYMDKWDGDRIISFAKKLAIRSLQIEDGFSKDKATIELDAALLNVCLKNDHLEKSKLDWAMLNACLKRMDVGALRQLSSKVAEWHKALRLEEIS